MAAFTSSAISTYSIAGGIDLRSGSPVAIDGSQTGLVIDSANVTDGAFNGSSSWATLAGIDLTTNSVAAVTAIVNVPGSPGDPTFVCLWQYGTDVNVSGFRCVSVYNAPSTGLQMLGCGAGTYDYETGQTAWNSGGEKVVFTQFDISATTFVFKSALDGATITSLNGQSPPHTAGTFGDRTLYVGAIASTSNWLTGTISFLILHDAAQDQTAVTNLAAALADPDTLLEVGGPTLVKYYPTADKSNAGSWTGEGDETTDLYTHISETTPNDSTYIQSPTNPGNAAVRFYFGTMTNPPIAGTDHTLRYHGWATGTADLTATLYGGDDTLIVAFTHSPASTDVGHLYEDVVNGTQTTAWLAAGYDGSYIEFNANTT